MFTKHWLEESIVTHLVSLAKVSPAVAMEMYFNSKLYDYLLDDEAYGLARLGGAALAEMVVDEGKLLS